VYMETIPAPAADMKKRADELKQLSAADLEAWVRQHNPELREVPV